MSATNRGSERSIKDYYITPIKTVTDFFNCFKELEPTFNFTTSKFLDPCAGGDTTNDMRYVSGLQRLGATSIVSLDIREDSPSLYKGNYLFKQSSIKYDGIFTNPPFNLAMEFIIKANKEVREGGFVGMLLRINYYGSETRKQFWKENMPKYTILHANRPSFIKGGNDATEYGHFVWQVGFKTDYSKLIVI